MKIFAIVVFVLVMGAIMTEKLHRATAALAAPFFWLSAA